MSTLQPHTPTQVNPVSDRMFHRLPYRVKREHPQAHSCAVCARRPRDFVTSDDRSPSYDFVCMCTGWSKVAPFYRNTFECFEPEDPE